MKRVATCIIALLSAYNGALAADEAVFVAKGNAGRTHPQLLLHRHVCRRFPYPYFLGSGRPAVALLAFRRVRFAEISDEGRAGRRRRIRYIFATVMIGGRRSRSRSRWRDRRMVDALLIPRCGSILRAGFGTSSTAATNTLPPIADFADCAEKVKVVRNIAAYPLS